MQRIDWICDPDTNVPAGFNPHLLVGSGQGRAGADVKGHITPADFYDVADAEAVIHAVVAEIPVLAFRGPLSDLNGSDGGSAA